MLLGGHTTASFNMVPVGLGACVGVRQAVALIGNARQVTMSPFI